MLAAVARRVAHPMASTTLPESELFLFADNGHHLSERVKRLAKKTAPRGAPALDHAASGNIRDGGP